MNSLRTAESASEALAYIVWASPEVIFGTIPKSSDRSVWPIFITFVMACVVDEFFSRPGRSGMVGR